MEIASPLKSNFRTPQAARTALHLITWDRSITVLALVLMAASIVFVSFKGQSRRPGDATPSASQIQRIFDPYDLREPRVGVSNREKLVVGD